jgi:uncharacterized repeat protein (TIGR03809 family)
MTDTLDTLRDYQPARWRQLAEKRLEHITDLFVSGRWTKYFSEPDFLEIVRESKAAVDAWRKLEPVSQADPRLPHLPFTTVALDVDEVVAPAAADSTEAELDAVAIAMAEVDEVEEPAVIAAESREPESVDALEFSEAPRTSLLPSPFEDAIGAVALQRLRSSG